MEGNRMKLDNYELSTIHYTISYYIDNANLDEDENEWLNLLKEKVDSIWYLKQSMIWSVVRTVKLLSHHIVI